MRGSRKEPRRKISPLSDAHPAWMNGAHSGMDLTEIHQVGAEKFGVIWLGANRVAVEAFTNCGVTPATDKLREALSLAVYRVLEGVVEARTLQSTATERAEGSAKEVAGDPPKGAESE